MFDVIALVKAAGYLGLLGIVFAETGLFVGFFLPGDSLLFAAGFLASRGFLHLPFLVPLLFIGAVLGNMVGYWFGAVVGPRIFSREDSFFFHRRHLASAAQYYETHGAHTIFFARFIPIIRTFAPIVAGVGRMRYGLFLFYNIGGAAVWVLMLTFLGYYLGGKIPDADRYILPIIGVIILISFLPGLIPVIKNARKRKGSV